MQRMLGVKKVFSFMFLALTVFVLLTACGGGGGGGSSDSGNNNPPPPNNNATITGTVSGTTVKAFDLSGNEVASNTAIGNPKTFSLNVPAGGSYKFYLIENEGTSSERVYALYWGTTNVFAIASAVTINLGFVSTATGVAVPANNPLIVSGVGDGGVDTAIPPSLAGSAFGLADLQGTWNFHGLISGDSPAETPGWYWGSFTADSTGAVTSASTITDSLGNSYYTPSIGAFNISTSGIVTNPGAASYRGVMNKNKDMIVATVTMAPGASTDVSGYNFQISLKSGGTFSLSDLQGTWNMHYLVAGDGPSPRNGWGYGTIVIDGNGNVTFTSSTRSDNDSTLPGPSTISITSSGVVSYAGISSFHGVMSQDKNMFIATMNDSGGGYALIIFQKAGGTFSQSDLTGTWNMHRLTSGDYPQWNGWTYGSGTADSSGSMAWAFVNRSNGNTSSLSTPMQLAIGSTEVVTDINRPIFQGVMSLSKDLIVATSNHNSTYGYNLWIFMK